MSRRRSAVVVTGAAGGIGAATALALATRGANVLAVDIDGSVEHLAPGSEAIVSHRADVTDSPAVQAAIAAAVERFGTLDAIFNNAGILGATARLEDYPVEVLHRVWQVNVLSVFLGMKHAIPALRANGGGRILNTASSGALVAAPEQSAYIASKHAVLGLTRTAAIELAGDGIAVNALCPGATDTPMLAEVVSGWQTVDAVATRAALADVSPVGHPADPEEVAEVATWLLLQAPLQLTGSPVTVDGAQTAR